MKCDKDYSGDEPRTVDCSDMDRSRRDREFIEEHADQADAYQEARRIQREDDEGGLTTMLAASYLSLHDAASRWLMCDGRQPEIRAELLAALKTMRDVSKEKARG